MAGMATGADLLVVQTALELGFGVDAMLPMRLEHYAADFDSGLRWRCSRPCWRTRRSTPSPCR